MPIQSLSRLIFATLLLAVAGGPAGADSCLDCHGDAAQMRALGYPHLTVTGAEVRAQTGMPATCPQCHLGQPEAAEKDAAHLGMGRLILVRKKGLKAETAQRKLPLEIGGNPMLRLKQVVERDGKKVIDPTVNLILYQDKRLDTLSQDFSVMERTCGACHAKELAEFRTSNMARNAKQSQYKGWTDRSRGPHNCGVWFAGNEAAIAAKTGVPFSRDNAALNQRACNGCHVGCLDCHYDPQNAASDNPRLGMHTFKRIPRPESCYGGGRGTICHAGPEERRRGAGYFGGSFSHPEGMEGDAHLAKGVACLDCHQNSGSTPPLPHGTVKRQASCGKCHATIVASHAASVHRQVSCEACHIRNVGGYQGTFWGPGELAGSATPFFKYKDYYGVMAEPILVRDQRGRWIPVKPYPMAVLNQKGSELAPGLHWRYPADLPDLERTDDAWGYVGLVGGLPENNKALLWIQMDKVSHKYGKGRSCASCHATADGTQRQEVRWEFSDRGALPFSGSHTVLANRDGLSIMGIKAEDKIETDPGTSLSALAPWVYLKESWRVKGNFALPVVRDRKRYDALRGDPAKAVREGVLHGR